MAKLESVSVKETVHKLQLALLDGVQSERQLLAAGSLISRADYEDVVTERTIAGTCGYPMCRKPLPTERPRKGRYRISLKEHRVYDLQETYMFCSTGCVVNSRTFSASLQEERCPVVNPEKLDDILRLFGDLNSEKTEEDLGKKLEDLKIQEKDETNVGEVSLEEWKGPSNAIEGYVPQNERISTAAPKKIRKQRGSNASRARPSSKKEDFAISKIDFTSEIIMNEEYTISKTVSGSSSTSRVKIEELGNEELCGEFKDQCQVSESLFDSDGNAGLSKDHVKNAAPNETPPKPSLKSSNAKKLNRSVTWADQKTDGAGQTQFCETKEIETARVGSDICGTNTEDGTGNNMSLFASAEACAKALSQAAEAVASRDSHVSDAVSEAGIIILPRPHEMEKPKESVDLLAQEPEPKIAPLKWPKKPNLSHSDEVDPNDSWFDAPPEGFSLTLSTFATMWNALFEWITSSSLAYIYGRDESFHEEYLSINGREYPQKIVLSDGRSSEIKETLAGCVSRALPGLVADLRLRLPLTTLEQKLAHLLDTMSFINALPAFRVKQWQVIVLLFIDALSVCRIPALIPHMTNGRMLLHKVLDGAQVSVEEYEIMKDLMIPLGRAPHFSAQSGA